MELYAQAYQQLASISAVLGGLSFTAALALFAVSAGTDHPDALSLPAKITATTAVVSAVFLVIAALMWSFMSADLSRAAARGQEALGPGIASLNWIPSIAMLSGVALFFTSIGASGWVASRPLGRLTTLAALLGGLALLLMLYWFADVNLTGSR